MDTITAPIPPPTATASRAFAARVVGRALTRADSILCGRRGIWTARRCAALTATLEQAADAGRGTFPQRWDDLLAGLDDHGVLLATEALAVHLWFPSDVRPLTKRRLLEASLGHLDRPVRLTGEVWEGLCAGVAGSGVAYPRRRLSQVTFVVRAVGALRALPPDQRRLSIDDPWVWKAHLGRVPTCSAHAQREVLLHLVHPRTFEPIISPEVKRRIAHTHAAHVPRGIDDVDAQLAAIRRALLGDRPRTPLRTLLPEPG